LKSDLLPVLTAACEGRLPQQRIDWDERVALGVVLAAPGYPGDYPKGATISDSGNDSDDQKVFHAGTKASGDSIVTSGGRVLCATALASSVQAAQAAANARASEVDFEGRWYRTDIGHRAIARGA
ncbi:MAG: phosphoribosylglycinamide synthetase C domain-containing protein, partial [Litorivicinus sp.]